MKIIPPLTALFADKRWNNYITEQLELAYPLGNNRL